jgi:hypothetical protein
MRVRWSVRALAFVNVALRYEETGRTLASVAELMDRCIQQAFQLGTNHDLHVVLLLPHSLLLLIDVHVLVHLCAL